MSNDVNTLDESLQMGATQFSLKLTKQLYQPGNNLVVSPFSVSYAMSMLLAGSDGNSRQELIKSLFDGQKVGEEARVEGSFAAFCQELIHRNWAVLKNMNLLYSHKSYPLKAAFFKTITVDFKARAKVLDFVGANQEALDTINNDVKEATNGLIDKILDEIASDTKVVLGNAIHFKGAWKTKFDSAQVKEADFHRSDGKTSKVAMMFANRKFPYYEDEKLKAVRLDYTSGSISMLLVLPNGENTVGSLLGDLHAAKLKDIQSSLDSFCEVKLWLPKFKLSNLLKLNQPLADLGIKEVFTENADFSKISDGEKIYLSSVIQSAVIEVNEEGTEAAAATLLMMRTLCLTPETHIRFDKPFLYFLLDRERNSILFSGVIEDPSQK